MWCSAPFVKGHRCVRAHLYHLFTGNPNNDADQIPENDDLLDDFCEPEVISLHALTGIDSAATMRIQATVGNIKFMVLIDSDSSSNFIDWKVMRNMRLYGKPVKGAEVMVANGDKMLVNSVCEAVPWSSQGFHTSTNFWVLHLQGCDAVLRVPWLQTLGQITWNFSDLTMQFCQNGNWFTLQGLKPGNIDLSHKLITDK